MSDTKQNATSSEYAARKREAHVPEVVSDRSPEVTGENHGASEIQNRKVNG
jgi:hypothetical protein